MPGFTDKEVVRHGCWVIPGGAEVGLEWKTIDGLEQEAVVTLQR